MSGVSSKDTDMKKIRTLAILNLLAFLIQLAITWLTQFRMINTKDVGQVSDEYPTLFTPAGITFSIWGLIYLLLAAFCIYHLIMAWRHDANHPANREVKDIGGLFILNNLATAAWLYTWTHEQPALALGLIIIQLVTLIAMNMRLHIYDIGQITGSRFFTQIPLSIYFGWITVATIANTDASLFATGWDRMGVSPVNWTMALIGLTSLIGIVVILARRNFFYGLVILWALAGIIVKRTQSGGDVYPNIILAAQIGMIVVGIVCLFQLARNIRYSRPVKNRTPFPLAPHPLK